MTPIDAATKTALENLISDDLKRAVVDTACVSIMDDGRIVVDEITFRREDGRHMSVDVGDAVTTVGQRTAHSPAMILETYVNKDSNRREAVWGWLPARVERDYTDELADLTAPPWRPGDDVDRLDEVD